MMEQIPILSCLPLRSTPFLPRGSRCSGGVQLGFVFFLRERESSQFSTAAPTLVLLVAAAMRVILNLRLDVTMLHYQKAVFEFLQES